MYIYFSFFLYFIPYMILLEVTSIKIDFLNWKNVFFFLFDLLLFDLHLLGTRFSFSGVELP